MLFSSPHSCILLPEMDVMTGALGASMDQEATQGRTWKLALVFDGSVELTTCVLECLTLTFYTSKKWNFILSETTLREGGCGGKRVSTLCR